MSSYSTEEEDENTQNDVEKKRVPSRRKKPKKNEFIDDEAELSGDDLVSEDELEGSDDDAVDLELVDQNAPELDSDEEEEVRGLYHKQLESEDRRHVLLLKEQVDERKAEYGQGRRRKFRWQTKEIMENSLKRHYHPDDEDDSQDIDSNDDDDLNFDNFESKRLRRPATDAIMLGNTRVSARDALIQDDSTEDSSSMPMRPVAGPSCAVDESTSNSTNLSRARVGATGNLNKFIYRDRELVEALSTREVVVKSREEQERMIDKELSKFRQSKSIFDQLYS